MEMIGFVGLGTIGGAIARNIQKASYPMMVRDIRPEATDPLVKGGAEFVGSPAEVARHCRIVFTSLPGPREVEEVALGPNGLLEGVHDGSLYVDLSSSSPDLIRRIEAEFRLRAARVIDAPLIVGKDGVANRSLQVLASGASEAYEEVKPLLGASWNRSGDRRGDRLGRKGRGGSPAPLGLPSLGPEGPTPSVGKNLLGDGLQGKLRGSRQFRYRPVTKRRRPRGGTRPPTQCADAHRGFGGANHGPGYQPGVGRARHCVPLPPTGGSRRYRGAKVSLITRLGRDAQLC
jgi:hypothetical protein